MNVTRSLLFRTFVLITLLGLFVRLAHGTGCNRVKSSEGTNWSNR